MKLPTKQDLEVWAITAAKGATKLEQELAASNLLGAAVLYQSEYEKLKAYWATVAAATIAANPAGSRVIAITEVDPVRADGCATLVPAKLKVVRNTDPEEAEVPHG